MKDFSVVSAISPRGRCKCANPPCKLEKHSRSGLVVIQTSTAASSKRTIGPFLQKPEVDDSIGWVSSKNGLRVLSAPTLFAPPLVSNFDSSRPEFQPSQPCSKSFTSQIRVQRFTQEGEYAAEQAFDYSILGCFTDRFFWIPYS